MMNFSLRRKHELIDKFAKTLKLLIIPEKFFIMIKTHFTLISKRSLTPDVYELIYNCPDFLKEEANP